MANYGRYSFDKPEADEKRQSAFNGARQDSAGRAPGAQRKSRAMAAPDWRADFERDSEGEGARADRADEYLKGRYSAGSYSRNDASGYSTSSYSHTNADGYSAGRNSRKDAGGYSTGSYSRNDADGYSAGRNSRTDASGYSVGGRSRTDADGYQRTGAGGYSRTDAGGYPKAKYRGVVTAFDSLAQKIAGVRGDDHGNYRRASGEPARGKADAPHAPGAPGGGDCPIYGGYEHDNIGAADARPHADRAHIIILAAIALLLIICVPLLIASLNRRVALSEEGVTYKAQPLIAAQGGSVSAGAAPTQAPQATDAGAAAGSSAQATDASGAQATPAPTSDSLMVSQFTGRTLDKSKPAIALTFDDGPSDQTPLILDILKQNGGLATFFPVGSRVSEYAQALRQARDMGCLVGTHLYSHTKLTTLSAEAIKQELAECDAAHIAALGTAPEIARPPYGAADDAVKAALNMPLVDWSLNSNDWETQNADKIFDAVINGAQDGDIVLFHDLKDFTTGGVGRIVPALVKSGYQLVTVQELFELKGQTLTAGALYDARVVAANAAV